MKFLIPTILTLLFFSPTSVFADEVSDVGLVCKKNEGKTPVFMGFWLEGSGKTDWYARDTSDKDEDGNTYEILITKSLYNWRYKSTDNEIYFEYYYDEEREQMWTKKLDRFTLEIKEKFLETENTHQCEVFESKVDFWDELKKKEEITKRHFEKRKI